MYDVVIVEDDFYVANLHKKYVEQLPNFHVVFSARTGVEVENYLASHKQPHLILLDMYIPDVEGVTLLWTLRERYKTLNIIMITAAKDTSTIQQALCAGVQDYLIKPVDLARFTASLARFEMRDKHLQQSQMGQHTLDVLFNLKPVAKEQQYPKGIDATTLNKVKYQIEQSARGLTAVSLAKEVGISRSTARRYLEYLVSVHVLQAELLYGDVGRPERYYKKA